MKFWLGVRKNKANDYRGTLLKRKKIYLGLLVLGLIYMSVVLLFLDEGNQNNEYVKGFGAGIIIFSFALLFQNDRMLKDGKKMEENKRKELDERNLLINNLALAMAARILLAVLLLGTVITAFIVPTYSIIFSNVVSIFLFIYLGCNIYFQKKM